MTKEPPVAGHHVHRRAPGAPEGGGSPEAGPHVSRLQALRHTVVGALGAALGLLVFAAMFSLSAFLVGPLISSPGGGIVPGPVPSVEHTEHTGDH